MEKHKIYLFSKEDIETQFIKISNTLTEILTRLDANDKYEDTKYLTRKETAKLLKISLPTLTSYVKQELIPVKRIGSRVLFLESEVWKAVENINFKNK